MNTISLRRIDRGSTADQIKVYMDAFGHEENEYSEIESRWKIKHYANPYGETYVFGAYDEDKLVGMNSFMPLNYCYRGKIVNVVQSCESGVLKSYQRRGIWQQIMIYAEDYFKKNTSVVAIIGFPNYENSYAGFLKMGYKTLYFERNMLMVCNGRILIESILGKHWWNRFARLVEIQKCFANVMCQIAKDYNVRRSLNEPKILPIKDNNLELLNVERVVEWKQYKSLQVFDVLYRGKVASRFYGYEEMRNGTKYFMLSKCYKLDENINEKFCYASIIKYLGKMEYAFIRSWCNVLHEIPLIGFVEIKKHKNPFIIKLLKKDSDYLLDPLIWDVGILDLD